MKTKLNKNLAKHIVELLNEALELDRPAIASLVSNRIPCNEALSDHPTIQIGSQHDGYFVDMLGILSGLCGVDKDNHGMIEAEFEEVDETKQRLPRLVRFTIRNK